MVSFTITNELNNSLYNCVKTTSGKKLKILTLYFHELCRFLSCASQVESITSRLWGQSTRRAPCPECRHQCTGTQEIRERLSLRGHFPEGRTKRISDNNGHAAVHAVRLVCGQVLGNDLTSRTVAGLTSVPLNSFTFCPLWTRARIFSPFRVHPGPSTIFYARFFFSFPTAVSPFLW